MVYFVVRITTNICYVPASQPHPCSPKRRQAYESGALIPGPMNDPDGWFDLPTASVHGIFQGSRQSKINCKVKSKFSMKSDLTIDTSFIIVLSCSTSKLYGLSLPNHGAKHTSYSCPTLVGLPYLATSSCQAMISKLLLHSQVLIFRM